MPEKSTKNFNSAKLSLAIFGVLFGFTALSGITITNLNVSADDNTKTDTVSVTISAACTMITTNNTYNVSLNPGQESSDLGPSNIKVVCNDYNGYSIYAIGYSGDSYTGDNHTKLIGTNGTISTGTSGDNSWWAMKMAAVAGDYTPSIENGYNSYSVIPDTFTQVAKYTGATDAGSEATGSNVQAYYKVKASVGQIADTYTGKVKYTLVHPNTNVETLNLYNKIASMSKGTQTLADIQAELTTANSGVYEYNPSVFGAASDAASTSTIYYYRGVLDETVGSYGSDGDGKLYPNYVKLANNTCWRIVRTTGSGGVKMIYNGTYGATTTGSCANATTAAQLSSTAAYGLQGNSQQSSNWSKNINRVGYTFNNDASIQDLTDATSVSTVFGDNSNYSTANTTDSNAKSVVETWYNDNMGSTYTNKLEPSAGYCNDRTAYSDNTTGTALETIPPYATSGASMYFGAYGRNMNATNAGKTPSLTCPRGTVDLYSYTAATDSSNKQLTAPVALLTADEASLAGSGRTDGTQGSAMNSNSFLRSGSYFWLLSPSNRNSSGGANVFNLGPSGNVVNHYVSSSRGLRPVISLTSGTTITSGSGTATDPWTVE